MGKDGFEITVNIAKMFVIFLLMVQLVPALVWLERRGSAFIQNRLGPNRVGPLGLTQLIADAIKFLFKEEFVPEKSVRLMFYGAPVMALIPAALGFASIPLSMPIDIQPFEMLGHTYGPYNFLFQGYDFGIGIVFVLGISSLGGYSLLMAGWGSSNKYALLGALRATAQLVSYELALGLSLVGILLVFGTFHFREMIAMQEGPLTFMWMGQQQVIGWLPNWGLIYNPLGALIFFAATFAETNRLPFDLPEAEGELVAGFHTEYGGFKMNLFFIGEYGHMLLSSALLVIFYFGGYNLPGLASADVLAKLNTLVGHPNLAAILTSLIFFAIFFAKIAVFLWIYVWVRWTLPRFRYDQLMNLGWKTMLPWALFNVVVTALWLVFLSH